MYSGLVTKFRVKRPLDQQERLSQLKQKEALRIEPVDSACVIKLNSTFLETTDMWFACKGDSSPMVLFFIGLFGWGLFVVVQYTLFGDEVWKDGPLVLFGISAMFVPFLCVLLWLLSKEFFSYTHYPSRFNRKTRMVYVFRTNGTVLATKWDKVFFTLGRLNQRAEHEVRGHILASDGKTIEETFALSCADFIPSATITPGQSLENDPVRANWEFIRRYMEVGPESVISNISYIQPIDARRETFSEGLKRIFHNNAKSPRFFVWLMFVPALLSGFTRFLAMHSCRIPKWPKEVEDACIIEPGDPCILPKT